MVEMPKIVAYSLNAPYQGGRGYILYEVEIAGEIRHYKTPMTEFLRERLK